jgi:hypothetical protein
MEFPFQWPAVQKLGGLHSVRHAMRGLINQLIPNQHSVDWYGTILIAALFHVTLYFRLGI